MSKKPKSEEEQRGNAWAFILYPESAPENWRSILDSFYIEWIESPLHDKDINEVDEEQKKSHWHILLLFDSLKSYAQIKLITDSLNAPRPLKAHSPKGIVRYMIHLDNPEKYQYPASEIIAHGGADVPAMLKMTLTNKYALIGEMRDFISDHNITEFYMLFDYAIKNRVEDWAPLLCESSAYVITEYIKSFRNASNGRIRAVKYPDPRQNRESEKKVLTESKKPW